MTTPGTAPHLSCCACFRLPSAALACSGKPSGLNPDARLDTALSGDGVDPLHDL